MRIPRLYAVVASCCLIVLVGCGWPRLATSRRSQTWVPPVLKHGAPDVVDIMLVRDHKIMQYHVPIYRGARPSRTGSFGFQSHPGPPYTWIGGAVYTVPLATQRAIAWYGWAMPRAGYTPTGTAWTSAGRDSRSLMFSGSQGSVTIDVGFAKRDRTNTFVLYSIGKAVAPSRSKATLLPRDPTKARIWPIGVTSSHGPVSVGATGAAAIARVFNALWIDSGVSTCAQSTESYGVIVHGPGGTSTSFRVIPGCGIVSGPGNLRLYDNRGKMAGLIKSILNRHP